MCLSANSTEFDLHTNDPVIYLMERWYDFRKGSIEERNEKSHKGGTMRLGAYTAVIKENSLTYSLYNALEVSERHRHRYEVNPAYHRTLTEKGMVFSGVSRDGRLVEFIELPGLDFFLATQAHPELKSRMETPAPLFYGFVKACMNGSRK